MYASIYVGVRPSKKCLAAITHEYIIAVERICGTASEKVEVQVTHVTSLTNLLETGEVAAA